MTRSEETYLGWVNGAEASMTRGLIWMVKGMEDRLGEYEGKKLFIEQLYKMGAYMGKQTKNYYASQGRENTLEEFIKDNFSESSIYTFAWTGGLKESSEHDAIVDWTDCPIANGFKAYGEEGVEIGELFCQHIDNSIISNYNPDYVCVRESSIYKTGLCRLHMKPKE